MEVPTLQEFSLLSLTDCLINEKCPCRVMKMQWQNLIRQLDQGSWGDTSKCLLDRMVTFYGRKVTPILIEALLPINAKDLILKKCPLVTEECLNEIFIRCNDLKILNLTKNPHFKFDKLDLFNNYVKINCKLTTVLLKGCPQVNDGHIKALLKNAPFLVSLNIAFCNISDNAFLFNGTPSNLDNFGCKLETIDLSFCETFSSIGVHRLCSLCGQTLQSINLFGTKADATALLYLSGFGLVEAEQFLNSMRDVTDKDYEQTTKITNLTFCDGIFQTEDQGLLCFQHFLRSNRNVSSLSFFCQTRSENYITDNVLQLIGDHAENLKSLTVIKGLHMTSSGIARLAQCKQLTNIQLSSSKTIEDAAIIELVQNLNLSNIDLCFTSVSSASLNAIAAKNMPDLLQELEVSWCVHLEEDPGGIHKLIQTCRSMKKLHITNCCVLSTTLNLLAENCHNITELIFGTQDTDYPDESIILLSKNLRLLQKVYMGANPSLTNRSMQALITNCRRLNDLDLYGLNVTSEPFLQLITVPDDLKKYLKDDVNRKILSGKVNLEDFNIELSELPCLPHRSMVHCTELRKLGFSDCPFVEREELKKLATVATTSLKLTMEVPTLKQFSIVSLTEYLITEKCTCGVVTMQWMNLIRQLDQGSWGDASKCLLHRLVKFYSRKVTPIIVEALLPINAKDLHLKKCHLVTEECLNKIMNRCNDLTTLNLKTNCHFKFDKMELFNSNFKNSCKLTTVVLEGCPQVHDGNIKALLKNAPLLVSLNVKSCNITDEAFLVNGDPSHFNNNECKLEAVNLRFCEKFSNTGVHHLCSLCGSTLQSIDLLKTKVDCSALLYLSGFGLDEAEKFLNSMRDVTDKDYEQTEIFFQAKIKCLSIDNCILQAENVAHRCFQQFLRSNRNVSCLRFYSFLESENYITDNVLKLIGDHARNLKSLTVVRGLRMTTSGLARLAQCKQLAQIELVESDTFGDSAIIELVQKLKLSHIKLSMTSVTRASLNAIAAKNMPDLLKELEVSWCNNLENDTVGLHNVIKSSKSLEKLRITNCRVLSTTLSLLSENCHNITELIFACDTDFSDEYFILLFKSLRLLEKIYMGPSSSLTDKSIEALLTHCRRLNNVHLFLLNVTLAPFLQIITVPDELKKCLTNFVNKKILSHQVNLSDFNIELSELPCLPHRSRVNCTELRKLIFSDCDFVKEEEVQMLAALAQGSLKISTCQSLEVEGNVASLKRFIQAQILHILEELPGFEKNYTFCNPGCKEMKDATKWLRLKHSISFNHFIAAGFWHRVLLTQQQQQNIKR